MGRGLLLGSALLGLTSACLSAGPLPYDPTAQRFEQTDDLEVVVQGGAQAPPGLIVVQAKFSDTVYTDWLAETLALSINQTGLLAARTTGELAAWAQEQSPPLSLDDAAGRAEIDDRFGGVMVLKVSTNLYRLSPLISPNTHFELTQLEDERAVSHARSDRFFDLAAHLDALLSTLCGRDRAQCAQRMATRPDTEPLPEVRAGLGNRRPDRHVGLAMTMSGGVAHSHRASHAQLTLDVEVYFGPHWGAFASVMTSGPPGQLGLTTGVAGGLAQYSLLSWLGLEYRIGLGAGGAGPPVGSSSQGSGPGIVAYQRLDLVLDLIHADLLALPIFGSIAHRWTPAREVGGVRAGGHDLYLGFGYRFEF